MFSMTRPFVVSVEGNIGSGKSTMLEYFRRYENVEVHPEPVKNWCNLHGENLLYKLYSDPHRWSLQFQSYVQLTRLRIQNSHTNGNKVKIIERSLQNNRFCFLKLSKHLGRISEEELAVLDEWHGWIENTMNTHLNLIVYLRTSPEIAYERCVFRGRYEERKISFNYVEELHRVYEDWLINKQFGTLPAPILVIDADKGLEYLKESYNNYKDEICGRKSLLIDI